MSATLNSTESHYDTPWTVTINGVAVGELFDDDLQAFERQVNTDHRLYLAQLINSLTVVFRVLAILFKTIPLCFFWITAAFIVFDASGLHEWSSVNDVTHVFGILLALSAAAALLLIPVAIIFRVKPLGHKNLFADRRNELIRKYLKAPSPGKLDLYKIESTPRAS